MSTWREQLLGDTRTKLLKQLRHSPRTVVELAQEFQLSSNGVRAHLSWLTAHGLVEQSGTQRDTGGKPARCYALTPSGEEFFPKAYAAALLRVLEQVAEQGAEPGLLLELMGAAGVRAGREVPVPASLEGKLASAAEAVRDLGGDVALEPTEVGWRIRGSGCPLSAAVAAQPATCEMIRALIAEVSGCEVTTRCQHGRQPNCCFELRQGPAQGTPTTTIPGR